MSLAKRLKEVESNGRNRGSRDLVLDALRKKIQGHLIQELGPALSDGRVSESGLKRQVQQELLRLLKQEEVPLSSSERAKLLQDLQDDVLGYGPIDQLLKDPEVTEVMVNGPHKVYVERLGKIHPADVEFIDETHLRRVIDKMVAQVGRRIDEATPMVDARLPDGSRINAIVKPLAVGGPFLTIRRFSADPFTVKDLIKFGTLTEGVADFLDACINARLNVIVSGGTGTGKTTLLNVLSSYIPSNERIVTIEDAKELQLRQEHVLPLEARPPNIEGRGEVRIRDLVRNALRMRPDRIIIGEARGGEALDMLQAMNTGHDGSLTTVHSNAPRDALARIETMVLMAGIELPTRAIREQMSSAIDLIIQLSRLSDGTRRVTHVTEVQSMEGEVVLLQDIFLFDFGMGVDEKGKFRGHLKSTGIPPRFATKFNDLGIKLDPSMFAPERFARRASGPR